MTDETVMVCRYNPTYDASLIHVFKWNVLVPDSYTDRLNLPVGQCEFADVILDDFWIAFASIRQLVRFETDIAEKIQRHVRMYTVAHVMCKMNQKKINF